MVNFTKERDILEFFPLALYSIGTMVQAGHSVEHGLLFVSTRCFGKVSQLFAQVLEVAKKETLEDGFLSIYRASENQSYKDAMVIFVQYARQSTPVADALVATGNRMQLQAVMARRNHLTKVKNNLIPATTILLAGIPFLMIVAYRLLVYTEVLDKETVLGAVYLWLIFLAVAYAYLYRKYIFTNPALATPGLQALEQIFKTETDAFIGSFLGNMAQQIELGMSLETAITYALPGGTSSMRYRNPEEQRLINILLSFDGEKMTFSTALARLSGAVNNRKFDLTVEFLNMARDDKSMSMGDMLRFLSESFWSSHITGRFYQLDITTTMALAFLAKMFFLMVLSGVGLLLSPLVVVLLVMDFILIGVCML